jgi:hypothetical protein
MKKTIFAMLVLVLALGALGVGVAFAQTEEPPADGVPPGRAAMREKAGMLRVYKVEAFATKLDLTVDEVTALLEGGTRLHQIALDNGVTEEDLPAFMQEVHQAALEAAVADGVLTQEQVDRMQARMQSRQEFREKFCDPDAERPFKRPGFRRGGMMPGGQGGGFWGQNQQP